MSVTREFRRGAQAIEDAAASKGGGNFRPFVPEIQWRDDKEEKFLLFLTAISDIPTIQYHDWIEIGTGEKANGDTYKKYEKFISRKDPAIGEAYDELEDRLKVKPKTRQIAAAVELVPITEEETVKGRPRTKVVGFEVKTDTYIRKTDNGDVEVVQPKIGLVVQAAQNFFGWLSSYDSSQGPIEDTPMQIVRRGKDAGTTYDFIALEQRPVDLSGLLDYLPGVSYLGDEEEVTKLMNDLPEDDAEAAIEVGALLLDKRLEELADKERYDELVGPIEKIVQKYGGGGTAAPKAAAAPRERPARQSRRAAPVEEAAPIAEAPSEAKADRFAKLREQVEQSAAPVAA